MTLSTPTASVLEQRRAHHGAHAHALAGFLVDAFIELGVVTAQRAAFLDALAREAALAAQSQADVLIDAGAGAAIRHFLAVDQFDHRALGVGEPLRDFHHALHEDLEVEVGLVDERLDFEHALEQPLQVRGAPGRGELVGQRVVYGRREHARRSRFLLHGQGPDRWRHGSSPQRRHLAGKQHGIERFADDTDGAERHESFHFPGQRLRGHEGDGNVGIEWIGANARQRGRTVETRHHDVEHHQVRHQPGQDGERFFARAAGLDLHVIVQAQRHAGDLPDIRIVVHVEHAARYHFCTLRHGRQGTKAACGTLRTARRNTPPNPQVREFPPANPDTMAACAPISPRQCVTTDSPGL